MSARRPFVAHPNAVLVESGSFQGDGIQDALDAGFKRVISMELSASLVEHCRQRFAGNDRVQIVHGSSTTTLPAILAGISEPVTFWLDGHYSCNPLVPFDPILGPCPLLKELDIIQEHAIKTHTILIDDRRLMYGHADPTNVKDGFFNITEEQVVAKLKAINPNYVIHHADGFVAQDVIVAKPVHIVHSYAHKYNSVQLPPGVADFLKGSTTLFELCQRHHCRLTLDMSQHVLSKLLDLPSSPVWMMDEKQPLQVEELFNRSISDIVSFVEQSIQRKPLRPIGVATNVNEQAMVSAMSPGCRQFLQRHLQPSTQLLQRLNDLMKIHNLQEKQFVVFHIRSSDGRAGFANMQGGGGSFSAVFVQALVDYVNHHIRKATQAPILIISDSKQLAHTVATATGCIDTALSTVHMGAPVADEVEGAIGTVLQFYLMGRSQQIYTYNAYGGGPSGFSFMASVIYQVPYESGLHDLRP